MASIDKNQLSDVDLELNTSQLSDLSSRWNNEIMSLGLSSLNIKGTFSALIGQKIGSNYITSLENAIKKVEDNAINIARIIGDTANEQSELDERNAKQSEQNNYNYYANNGYNGNNNNTGDYTGKENGDLKLNEDKNTDAISLTDESKISLVTEFKSIYDGDMYDALFNEEFAETLKKQLLESPNINEDTKKILMEIDPKVIQVYLRNILSSGESISGVSKLVATVFSQTLDKLGKKETLFDASKNISIIFAKLSKDDNFMDTLNKIYNDEFKSDEIEDNTIYFTRDFVDTLSASTGVSHDELLTNAKYKESLKECVNEVSNTFAIIRGSNNSSELYSNIIVYEKGNDINA